MWTPTVGEFPGPIGSINIWCPSGTTHHELFPQSPTPKTTPTPIDTQYKYPYPHKNPLQVPLRQKYSMSKEEPLWDERIPIEADKVPLKTKELQIPIQLTFEITPFEQWL